MYDSGSTGRLVMQMHQFFRSAGCESFVFCPDRVIPAENVFRIGNVIDHRIHALIQERKIGSDEIINIEVSGDSIQAVHMFPGYTHNIINLSDTENLVTMMWANEPFDPNHPDTYSEKV